MLRGKYWGLEMKLQKKDVWNPIEKRKVKRCIYHSKKGVNEHFGRKMSQDANGNRKLFWKEVSKVESCSRVKDGNGKLAL